MLLRNPYDEPRGVLSDEQLRDYYALKAAVRELFGRDYEKDYEVWERLGQLASIARMQAVIDACYGVADADIRTEIMYVAHECLAKGMRYDGFRHELIMTYRYTIQVPEDEEDEDAGSED